MKDTKLIVALVFVLVAYPFLYAGRMGLWLVNRADRLERTTR